VSAAPGTRWERAGAFRRRLLAGEPVFGTFLTMASAVSAEVCGGAGFDWCLVDLEHGLGGELSLHAELLALELTGTPALVRVESGAPLRLGRVLDHGAAGVMVPRIRSTEEAAEVVARVRYPPAGVRGVALSARGAGYGAAAARELGLLDDAVTVVVQIENESALRDAAAIAALDGVDVLFVGPNDLSHTLGIPGEFEHPRYLDALAQVTAATRAAGKVAGIMLRSTGEVPALRELGYTLFGLQTDAGLLAGAARTALAAMRATG
jgi:2-dehydro-3-deoxyglucarate aldolase/4-hydroxy-2-oxoheptanedioate aldolase